MKTRAEREAKGRRGEAIAAWYLRLKGWRILGQRIRTPRGEVDLVARRGRTLAFVEVKWRKSAAELENSIDAYRLRRVVAAAQVLAHRFARPGDEQRIDVVQLAPGRLPRHLINVWID